MWDSRYKGMWGFHGALRVPDLPTPAGVMSYLSIITGESGSRMLHRINRMRFWPPVCLPGAKCACLMPISKIAEDNK